MKIFLHLGLDPWPELNFGDTDAVLSSCHLSPEPGHMAEPFATSQVSLTEKDWSPRTMTQPCYAPLSAHHHHLNMPAKFRRMEGQPRSYKRLFKEKIAFWIIDRWFPMLKPQHIFIRSLLALNIIDDSLHLLSKLQIILSAVLLSKICKYLKLLRKVLNYSCQMAAYKP